jgi:hypothetical protein
MTSKQVGILERLRASTRYSVQTALSSDIFFAAITEIERLRAALEQIAANDHLIGRHFIGPAYGGGFNHGLSINADLARKALQAKTPDPFRQWADAEVEKITDEEVARALAGKTNPKHWQCGCCRECGKQCLNYPKCARGQIDYPNQVVTGARHD